MYKSINTYIINLDKHEKRKVDLIDNIKSNNYDKWLDIHFIKAIDGANLTLDESKSFTICPHWYDPYFKTGITEGEIGCALSHYKAWTEFYNSGKKHAIFLEDDVTIINDNFEKNLTYLLSYPHSADIVYILRKPLFPANEKELDNFNIFKEIKASYWMCGYLLTRNGVQKLLNCGFLNNLIVVDEFLPILYDNSYLNKYKKFYNTSLKAYSLINDYSFIKLNDNTFLESSTFHSNYYNFDSKLIAFISKDTCSLSSISRFEQSCKKYSVQVKYIDIYDVIKELECIDDDKYIIFVNCNYCFLINNPLEFIENNNEKDFYYTSFSNKNSVFDDYINRRLFFFGKKYILNDILCNPSNNFSQKNVDGLILKLTNNEDKVQDISNFVLLDGFANPLLLNKYENYILNKVCKTYGLTNVNLIKNQNYKYNYKVLVNILAYNEIDAIKRCLDFFKILDYPKELLEIHIYTNSTNFTIINKLEYSYIDHNKIYIIEEKGSYNEIYKLYFNYDYVWVIYSYNIFIEPSVLKDLIDTQKNIVSGLIVKNNTLLSNFWGAMNNTGWYLRSDDYLDILNRNNINVWNVPFINSNILFHKSVFKKYYLLRREGFNDIDMKICFNCRINNEAMYLLNKKLYGHIYDPDDRSLNSVLTSISSWSKERIFTSEYLDFYNNNNNKLFKEVEKGSDIWYFPFFRPEFCDYLLELAERSGNWSAGVYNDKNSIDKRIGAVENIPTQDIHLKDIGLHDFWVDIVNDHFKRIMSHLYKYKTANYHIAFIVKYDAEKGQASLQGHHDASVYTTNIALCDGNDYEGGGIKFHTKNITLVNKDKGYLCLHPGRVTHYHEALPITQGKRYVLVSFNN